MKRGIILMCPINACPPSKSFRKKGGFVISLPLLPPPLPQTAVLVYETHRGAEVQRENHLVCFPCPHAGIVKSRDVLLFWLLGLRHLRNDGGQRAEGSEVVWKGVMHTAGSLG